MRRTTVIQTVIQTVIPTVRRRRMRMANGRPAEAVVAAVGEDGGERVGNERLGPPQTLASR